jgi:hypothetical protein
MLDGSLLWAVGTGVFAGGLALGGAKVAMNGTKDRVLTLEGEAKHTTDRLARIETKIDTILEHSKGT